MVRDLDRLQGTWHVTSFEADGQTLAAAAFDGATIVINGSRFISLAMGATYEGRVEIHQARKPKSLDLVFTAGPEKRPMPIRSSPRPQQSRALCGFVHNGTKAAHWAQSAPSNSLGIHANHNTSMA